MFYNTGCYYGSVADVIFQTNLFLLSQVHAKRLTLPMRKRTDNKPGFFKSPGPYTYEVCRRHAGGCLKCGCNQNYDAVFCAESTQSVTNCEIVCPANTSIQFTACTTSGVSTLLCKISNPNLMPIIAIVFKH